MFDKRTYAGAGLPRIGRRPSDPDTDFAEMMSLDASMRELRVRSVMGPDAIANLMRAFHASEAAAEQSREMFRAERRRTLPSLPDFPAMMVFSGQAVRFDRDFVGPAPLSEDPPTANRFEPLLNASLDELLATGAHASHKPLLDQLVRHALLLEMVRCSDEARAATSGEGARALREPELPEATVLVADLLRTRMGTDLRVKASQALTAEPLAPALDLLKDHAEALNRLGACPDAELDRLLTETLDTCSHRVDAWVTSLFTRRLADMRHHAATGCLVGAFGWLQGLRSREGTLRPLMGRPRESEGFVHAPSLDHAATAAILLNAHLSHLDERAEQFRIRLPSARVRASLEIVDAVRGGQSFNEVLGALLERRLHDRQADACIDQLRQAFPLSAARPSDTSASADVGSLASRNITDGLAVLDAWRARLAPLTALLSRFDPSLQPAFQAAVAELASTLDGLADLFTAEAAFQAVRGNFASANAALNALASGKRPPEPEVVRTPRGGASVTHRILLTFPADPPLAEGWPVTPTARALLMPALDAWAGTLLGNPDLVVCKVFPIVAKEASTPAWVSLADLGVRPLDVVAMARELPVQLSSSARRPLGTTELERRIEGAIQARLGASAFAELLSLDVQFVAKDPPEGKKFFAGMMAVAGALWDLMGKMRGLRGSDIGTPETVSPGGDRGASPAASSALDWRATPAASAALGTLLGAYDQLAARPGSRVDVELGYRTAAQFGISDAMGATPDFPDDIGRRERVCAEMRRRVGQAAREGRATAPSGAVPDWGSLRTEAQGRISQDPLHVIESLFAQRWPVSGRFELAEWPAAPRPGGAPATSITVSPDQIRTWFRQIWRVRPAMATWRKLSLFLGRTPNDARSRQGIVLQVEPTAYGRWAALGGTRDGGRWVVPPSGTVSMLALQPLAASAQPWTGLLLDEWTEFIPNEKETTGLLFHHDDPGAEAPQAVLLAVPPDLEKPWTAKALVDTLRETLELARMRAIDLSHLDRYAQLLPAIYLAQNDAVATVSTTFVDQTSRDPSPGEGVSP